MENVKGMTIRERILKIIDDKIDKESLNTVNQLLLGYERSIDSYKKIIDFMESANSKREIIYQKYFGRCGYTGRPITYAEMTLDHIIPISLGGSSEIENLIPTFKEIKVFKNNYVLEAFRRQLMGLHKYLHRCSKQRRYVANLFGITWDNPFSGKFFFEPIDGPIVKSIDEFDSEPVFEVICGKCIEYDAEIASIPEPIPSVEKKEKNDDTTKS